MKLLLILLHMVSPVRYTSGSTGPPKARESLEGLSLQGVMLQHQQLVAFVAACAGLRRSSQGAWQQGFIQFGELLDDQGRDI